MPFQPGKSGNPGGRARNPLAELIRSKKKLPQEIYDAVRPLLKSKKESTIIWAAEYLRDSGWGKPAQSLEVSGDFTVDKVEESMITSLVEKRVKEILDSSSKR